MRKTVVVGLSGGVDSAVSAHVLKEAGYDVIGAFIKGWEPSFLPCTGAADRLSAMRVAAHLEIPFVTVDLEREYERDVVSYFVEEYRAGRTPNPDVMCNRFIKFGAFMSAAEKLGADFVATGHYARSSTVGETNVLKTAVDEDKDQTYFLWTLSSLVLKKVLFPVGELTKPEVRRIARAIKLPNALRKDSQGLCFLGHVDMKAFLMRYIPSVTGAIRDMDSDEEIGQHQGFQFYTLGEHIPLTRGTSRMYVVDKDIEKNILYVRNAPLADRGDTYALRDGNWILGVPGESLARYRYRGELVGARIARGTITFEKSVLIAPGQSVVAYSKDGICLGGATVERMV